LRHNQKPEAARWLDRLEDRIRALTKPDPKAIATLIDLRLQQGSVKQVEPWLAKLDAADRDPFRPLIARVKYYAALPNVAAIGPAVETQASRLMTAAKSLQEQSRIARQIGDLYLLVNQLAGAEKWYRKLLESDPGQFEFLATALVRQGRAREAIRLCETATANDTTSRPAVILTSLLLETGAKPEYMKIAEPLLAAALEKFPEDVNLLYHVGMLRVLEDRYPDAVSLLQKVIKLNPRHVPALNNLAMLLAESEETRAEGLALVERAIAHRGHQPTLLDTKGTILLWSGRTQDAVELLEAAARGSTTDPRHGFHLALAYSELGATGHAFEQLALATERKLELQILTPTDRKALRTLQAALARASAVEGKER
jgi:tetratricopeptide (TPR) repeat protein